MRHSQPDALTLLVSGYPDVKSAMDAIFLEADEIIVKPFEAGKLAELIHQKMSAHKPAARTAKERVAAVLQRCSSTIVEEWLTRVKRTRELTSIPLTDKERTGYLPKLIEDLIVRLIEPNVPGEEADSVCSTAAVPHGKMRQLQGGLSRHAGPRFANPPGHSFRNPSEKSKRFGFQLALTRCHDHSGRGRFPAYTSDG